jgi:hypothetical protein
MTGTAFYNNVVPLNRDRHRALKLRADARMSFAAGTHFVPLAAVELCDAARDYPIVFAGGEDASPVAILGLRSGENLFLDANARWLEGTYVPAFVRRYPFILAGGGESTQYTVCLDESFEGLSETEGTALFDEEGKESELVTRFVGLLKDFLRETERTRRFVERLGQLELLTLRSMQVQDRFGRTYALQEFRVIDDKKLAELGNDVVGELHRSGYLACIHAHLISLGTINRLAQRLPAEANDAPA